MLRLSPVIGSCLLVASAFAVRTLLDPLLGDRSPYLLFTFAVLVAGARFGVLPGLLVTAASTVIGRWAFLPPRHSFGPITADEWTNVAAFIATSLAILVFTHQLIRSREAEAESLTQIEAASTRLQESQQRLASIVDSAMDSIITINDAQEVILFNPAAEKMFGYQASDIIGGPITRLLPERFRDGHSVHIERFREEGITNRRIASLGTVNGLRASGEEFPIEASISHAAVGDEALTTVILRDITDRKLNEEAQMLLAREVDHRAKNALAVAQALVSLTRADTVKEYADAVTGRIASLSRAHSLLSRSRWTGASLRQVLCDELAPYAKDPQIRVVGPDITLTAEAVQPLSLVFHELATNALKHGALSLEWGRTDVTWDIVAGQLCLTWVESGGPVVREPERAGFGSKLLEKTVRRQLGAELSLAWLPEGLKAELTLPGHLVLSAPTSHRSATEPQQAGELALDGAGRTVLVVEDEELVAMELVAELERLGWRVLGPAASVVEAEAFLGSAPPIDAAVLDVNLRGRPVYPLAEKLENRKIPFLFCTGYEVIDPAGRFQHVPVIRKPAHGVATAAALQRMLPPA